MDLISSAGKSDFFAQIANFLDKFALDFGSETLDF